MWFHDAHLTEGSPRGARIRAVQASAPPGVLQCLNESDPGTAWRFFLEECTSTIERAVRRLVSDPDEARDLVVDVLQRIRRTWPDTLQRFEQGEERAAFRTWLAVVARNHGIDALRSRHGRRSLPRPVSRLEPWRRELFRRLHWEGESLEEAHRALVAAGSWSGSFGDLAAAAAELEALVPRSTRVEGPGRRRPERARGEVGVEEGGLDPPAPAADAPGAVQQRDAAHTALGEILAQLSGDERLLLRTYFLEGATARDVAQLTGASSPSRVYERVGALTERLRLALFERGVEAEDLPAMMDFDWGQHLPAEDTT